MSAAQPTVHGVQVPAGIDADQAPFMLSRARGHRIVDVVADATPRLLGIGPT
jgi:hypothetical protein